MINECIGLRNIVIIMYMYLTMLYSINDLVDPKHIYWTRQTAKVWGVSETLAMILFKLRFKPFLKGPIYLEYISLIN